MGNKKRTTASQIALGGVLAALAVVIMCLGTLIPGASYICPLIAIAMNQMILDLCGRSVSWAWYGAVTLLSVLLAPDKEAAAVFLFLGYYPIVKPWMDGRKYPALWKALFFNASITVMGYLLFLLLGIPLVEEEYAHIKEILVLLIFALGNLTFFLADRLLVMLPGMLGRKK